MLISMINF